MIPGHYSELVSRMHTESNQSTEKSVQRLSPMARAVRMLDWKVAAPLIITVLMALSGYYYTYQKDLSFAKRKDQLERVDRQLSELYGPLYASSSAGNRIRIRFRNVYRPNIQYWRKEHQPTEAEASAWRHWMKAVI